MTSESTPYFTFSQDENTLTLSICSYECTLDDLDVHLEDERTFLYSCKSHFLRLYLPGSCVQDERYKVDFDSKHHLFVFTFGKKNPGEQFQNLSLIAALLAPKPNIALPEPTEEFQIDLEKEQRELDQGDYGFGFGHLPKHKYALGPFMSEYVDVFALDPRELSVFERHRMRLQIEQGKFNADHYLADFFDFETMQPLIKQKCPYEDEDIELSFEFTRKEFDFLAQLDTCQFLSQGQIIAGFHGLVELMFAYCYDRRINNFEECSESSWNINKLAASLCWFDVFRTPKDSIITAFRRSLIYPLYRNFELSCRVLQDLKCLLCLPERHLTRALIEMYDMFQASDKAILNKLFICDYLVFVQKWDPEHWRSVVDDYLAFEVEKDDVGLNLKQLEESCLVDPMAGLTLQDEADSDDCSSLSEYSSDDTDSSSYY